MTSTELPLSQAGVPGPGVPDVVAAVTGAMPVTVTVKAVIVTQGHTPYLTRALAAVRAQTRCPDEIVVVDTQATEATARHTGLSMGEARFVAAPKARTFGQAVAAGLAAVPGGTWLWLLHDDCAPTPTALAELLRAVEHYNQVAVAGPKQRRWIPGEELEEGPLIEVGVWTSPLGRRMTGIGDDEIDQGQHDDQADVDRLAVGLTGSLVRREVWEELGGTDPELGVFGDGLDLCRRARLAGHRVVVVPQAVVHHVQASLYGLRRRPDAQPNADVSFGPRRRSQLHARLVNVPLVWLPFVALAMLVAAPFHAMYRLALKQPGHARDEIVAPLWCLVRVVPLTRGRAAIRRTSVMPRRSLRELTAGWRDVRTERRERRLSQEDHTAEPLTELEVDDLRRIARNRRGTLAAVLAALVAVTALVFAPLIPVLADGGRLVGGALLPVSTSLTDLAQSAVDGWIATGTGVAAPADPLVTLLPGLAALTGGNGQLAMNILVMAILMIAGLGAWFAAGALTRSPALRAWAVLVWVSAPTLTGALSDGHIGSMVVIASLPWFALALLRAVGLRQVDVSIVHPVSPAQEPAVQHGSLAAAAAAALALVVVSAGAPILLVAICSALVVMACALRHYRRYLLLIPVPALVVLAPYLVHCLQTWSDGGWRSLLAEPGAPFHQQAAPAWQQVLGQAGPVTSWFAATGSGPWAFLAHWGPLVAGGVVLVLAALALVRCRRGAAAAWVVALIGLVTAVGSSYVSVGIDSQGQMVSGWPGPGLSLMLLALLGAALIGFPRIPARGGSWRAVLVCVVAVLATALPLTDAVSWTTSQVTAKGNGLGALEATSAPAVPAVGMQMQQVPRQARILALTVDDDGTIGYAALRSNGAQANDASSIVAQWSIADPAVGQGPLPGMVALLTSATSSDAATDLAEWGIGGVLVPGGGDPTQRAELVARLDTVTGLQRITEGQSDVMWRVAAPATAQIPAQPSWAVITGDGDGTASAVRSVGRWVDTHVDAGAEGRRLVLAESSGPGWNASVNGHGLHRVDDPAGRLVYELPASGGHLVVYRSSAHTVPWLVVGGLVLLVYVLLALPIRRRRAGGR